MFDNSIFAPSELRKHIQKFYCVNEKSHVRYLVESININNESKIRIYSVAKQIIEKVKDSKLNIIDAFIQKYSLTSDEGIALMCLAESLLRIPDNCTIDELIKDKIANCQWDKHTRRSSSLFVNASTWALAIGRNILTQDIEDLKWYNIVNNLIKRFGEPIIRGTVTQFVSMLSKYFITGETIEEALETVESNENKALYSYDMLGEAAYTAESANDYFNSYMHAIKVIGSAANAEGPFKSDGISIKLSALHPRYEFTQLDRIKSEMIPKVLELCCAAKEYNIPLCIDAEEAKRLETSLIIFEALRLDQSLNGWEGLGLAVQAYQKRALAVLDFIEDVAIRSKHKVMVRLVKGAYWDFEIKNAQELGLDDYPVFTRKAYTDVSYLVCAQKLLSKENSFYPCFATHNAHTLSAIIELADKDHPGFEFQRLYGMGKNLYDYVISELASNINCRIYAPIGNRSNLLCYLIRRLLENGASSSFINQINNPEINIEELIADPIDKAKSFDYEPHPSISLPKNIISQRKNSSGIDINDSISMLKIEEGIKSFIDIKWQVGPIINGQDLFSDSNNAQVINPARLEHVIGYVSDTNKKQALEALDIVYHAWPDWKNAKVQSRAECLEKAADLIENESMLKLVYLLIVEAGKTIRDAIAEVREAIDFLRYYATIAKNDLSEPKVLPGIAGEDNFILFEGRGVFLCISPWNFPLAIFIGQVAAALVAGNTVLAKPAEQTPTIAYEATKILLDAGVPKNVLSLLPGDGEFLGKTLIPNKKVAGVAFTGSTQTAFLINKMLADRDGPISPLIAETGGLNAMIVDSSALLEQVTADVLLSAFGSSGQRCSSLRVLFIQNDIADEQIKMICGAMEELRVGDPILFSTDIGPIIDKNSLETLHGHTKKMPKIGKLICKTCIDPHHHNNGYFFPPHAYEIEDISQLKQEVFGSILHIVRYEKSHLDKVISDINSTGYGLTFALQSRVQNNIDYVSSKISAGNIYINRNQIGAVVEMQPFGGRGLSGTGPKAGGPYYLHRFSVEKVISVNSTAMGGNSTLLCLEP